MKNLTLYIINFNRYFLKYIYVYVSLFLIILFSINKMIEKEIILKIQNVGAYKINKIIFDKQNDEIPFFGSSRCEGVFIPDSIVKNGFNYGIGGTQDDVINFMLVKECLKNKKTPIIINFDLEGINSSLGDISNYIYNYDDREVSALLGKNFKINKALPLFRYFGFYSNFLKYFLTYNSKKTYITNRGASLLNKRNSLLELKKSINESRNDYIFFKNDEIILNTLKKIINKNKNRKFIFVVTPYHKVYKKNIKNFEDFIEFKNKMTSSFKNVVFIDFSNIDFDDSFFYNTTHLNYSGALKFSSIFKDSLIKHKLLPL